MSDDKRELPTESLREAALNGAVEAKLDLAKRLLSQEPYDIPAGCQWARAAAADGNAEAEHLLAVATAEGLGPRQDWQVALDHLTRSAELGDVRARAELAALAGDWSPSDAADWSASTRNWKVLRQAVDVTAWLRSPTPQVVSPSPPLP